MESKKGSQSIGLLLVVLIGLGAYRFDVTRQIFEQARDFVAKALGGGGAIAAASPGQDPASAQASDASAQAQATVEAYMRKYSVPGSTLSFLGWSDFATAGQTAAITVSYRVQQPGRPDVVASVRFTIQGGNVVASSVLPAARPLDNVPATHPMPTRPPVVVDRFSMLISDSMNASPMTLQTTDAFSLSQLEQAKAKAIAERKPLGFLMVWGQFFGQESDTTGKDSVSALMQFYQVFNQNLVLVFVRHETELGRVPAAVAAGFRGPDEGGFAPNMAVTDASCTEFIVEIPYKSLGPDGRAQLFAEGGRKIDEWLATHPAAIATPAPAANP